MAQTKSDIIVLVRYGELALKSTPVRRRFEDILVFNIKSGLKSVGLQYKVRKDFGRIFIEGYSKKIEGVLKRVFGVVSFSQCKRIETNLKKIKKELLILAKKIKKKETFAVRCHRVGQHKFTSQDIERSMGGEVVEKFGLKVNLTKPDKTIHIEIRDRTSYVFLESIPCFGGLPIGTAGKVVCIIKNLDDVVASWLFMKRGCLIFPVISSRKHLSLLERWYIGQKLRYYLLEKPSSKKINNIVKETRSEAIVTGEILSNFRKSHFDVTVFRPLVGLDKNSLTKFKKLIKLA